MLRDDERRLLEQRIDAIEVAYEDAARAFLRAREAARSASGRRVVTLSHLELSRDFRAQLRSLYDLVNADDNEWAALPK
jgi:hypothetical protein